MDWLMWPVDLTVWWYSENVNWLVVAMPVGAGLFAGGLVGTWRFAASDDAEELGVLLAFGGTIGFGLSLLGPPLLTVAWFGWPLGLAWYGFYRLARRLTRPREARPEPAHDPALAAAYKELEAEGL
jgi:hypothetical protein